MYSFSNEVPKKEKVLLEIKKKSETKEAEGLEEEVNSTENSLVEETDESKSRVCNISECPHNKYGKFDECKKHFMERHRKNGKFKWSPSKNGFKSLKDILKCYGHVYYFGDITIDHLNSGIRSKFPLTCIDCDYYWMPTINGLINKGTGCPDCSGCAPMNLERFKKKMEKRPEIDISEVKKEHVINSRSNVPVSCKACGHSWCPVVFSLTGKNMTGCPECAENIRYNLERFKSKMRNRPEIDISGVKEEHISGHKSHVPVKCVVCDYGWSPSIDDLVNMESGCPSCCRQIPWTYKRFKEEMKEKRPDIDISNVKKEHVNKGGKSKVPVKCRKCKHSWLSTIIGLIQKQSGCPKCNLSRAVRAIMKYLDDLGVNHEEEKTFEGLVFESCLRIDIYIPTFPGVSLPICLEYDGNRLGSHFRYSNEEEKESHFLTVKRDQIKDNYIMSNGMHMVRIPYTCFPNYLIEKLYIALDATFAYLKTRSKPRLYWADWTPYEKRDEQLTAED